MDGISRGTNAAFQKGQQVEQYQIVEVLTPTRFGHIYLGQHMYQPIQVLIEGLLPPLLDKFKEDFLKCAQALKNLEHPHILQYTRYGYSTALSIFSNRISPIPHIQSDLCSKKYPAIDDVITTSEADCLSATICS